jgi:predicted aspartyl protease
MSLAKTQQLDLYPSNKFITTANGQHMAAPHAARIQLSMAEHTREVEMHFTEKGFTDQYEIIIGMNAMNAFPNYTVDPRKRTLAMGDNVTRWSS